MKKFIGREEELSSLEWLSDKKTASLVVVKGRRRIGKSRLIEEFSKGKTFYSFMGLAPTEKTTIQSQLDEFARQISRMFVQPLLNFSDWGDAFWYLSKQLPKKKQIILFDEISWIGSKDPDFMGKLKTAWDQYFKNHDLILVLCGSISVWIEDNILRNTAFVGRISQTLTLRELPLETCNMFWGKYKKQISAFEKFKILALTGGVPRYLEEIHPNICAEENIKQLCFKPEGFLFNEFDRIFEDVLTSRSPLYKRFVQALAKQSLEPLKLCEAVGTSLNSDATQYLDELVQAGFIARDYTWKIKEGVPSKISQYRLQDNYLRFYLKYIEPIKHRVEQGGLKSLSELAGLSSLYGFQFENLVLNNRKKIWSILRVSPNEIVCDNPYLQRKTNRWGGCQIDYMIQTKYNCLFVVEVKFSKSEIKLGVIEEVQSKIDKLVRPKSFSIRTVLIHVNGVSEQMEDAGYFSSIIDFSDLFD